MAEERANLIYRAKLAEEVKRYDDMAKSMRKATQIDGNLTREERKLLSVAYKDVVGARRASWRVLADLEQQASGNEEYIQVCRKKVEQQLSKICNEVLELIKDYVLQSVEKAEDAVESKVFFLTMMGDYYRYLAEFADRAEKSRVTPKAKEAYEKATEAGKSLPPTNAVILGLGLSFSVFYYEIMQLPQDACKLAKKAFDSAIAELDNLQEESYKESTLIIQLLRDNLTLWTSDPASA